MKSDLLNLLQERGFIYQCTDIDSLDDLLFKQSITGYIGFDCTAESLHVGSLLQIMILFWMKKFNHNPIVLLGDSTSLIGDPSGKNKARSMLDKDLISKNFNGIKELILRLFPDITIVNNSAWLKDIKYLDFLRDYGIYFSINQMINYDSIKQRLTNKNSNLSFLEFNYMLLQAYDFIYLAKHYDCRLQLGGSDQWGNIINGIELGARLGLPKLFGLTSPLIIKSDGEKMGKTTSGAIWLREKFLSPFDYWQFWRNVDDKDVVKFLKLFTFLPLDEINKMSQLKGKDLNEIKKILATEATAICHGSNIACKMQNQSVELFEKNNVNAIDKIQLSKNCDLSLSKIILLLNITCSNTEAKKLIKNCAIKINNQVITDEFYILESYEKTYKLSFGKKKHFILKFV